MIEEIYAIADSICKAGEGSGLLEKLCGAAVTEFTKRLREGVTPENCCGSFAVACALLASSMYLDTVSASGGNISYTAGQVSVSGSGEGNTDNLKKRAEEIMAPYTNDGGFEFIGVRG